MYLYFRFGVCFFSVFVQQNNDVFLLMPRSLRTAAGDCIARSVLPPFGRVPGGSHRHSQSKLRPYLADTFWDRLWLGGWHRLATLFVQPVVMSRRILPGSCLDDSSEFQNLPWLGRCACCVLLLCESRTKWYLLPDGKALVLIHEQQPLSVPQTRTVINRSFVIILEKLMPFSQKSVCRGEGEVICRKQDLPDTWFYINYCLGADFEDRKASAALCRVCTSCSLGKVRPCRSSEEKLSAPGVRSIRELRMPPEFLWGWLALMSKQARSMNEAFHFSTILIMGWLQVDSLVSNQG